RVGNPFLGAEISRKAVAIGHESRKREIPKRPIRRDDETRRRVEGGASLEREKFGEQGSSCQSGKGNILRLSDGLAKAVDQVAQFLAFDLDFVCGKRRWAIASGPQQKKNGLLVTAVKGRKHSALGNFLLGLLEGERRGEGAGRAFLDISPKLICLHSGLRVNRLSFVP